MTSKYYFYENFGDRNKGNPPKPQKNKFEKVFFKL